MGDWSFIHWLAAFARTQSPAADSHRSIFVVCSSFDSTPTSTDSLTDCIFEICFLEIIFYSNVITKTFMWLVNAKSECLSSYILLTADSKANCRFLFWQQVDKCTQIKSRQDLTFRNRNPQLRTQSFSLQRNLLLKY